MTKKASGDTFASVHVMFYARIETVVTYSIIVADPLGESSEAINSGPGYADFRRQRGGGSGCYAKN